jgi:hypothetical protein
MLVFVFTFVLADVLVDVLVFVFVDVLLVVVSYTYDVGALCASTKDALLIIAQKMTNERYIIKLLLRVV